MKTRALATTLALGLLTACETTNLAPTVGVNAQLEDDETRLWARAREEEAILDQSGFLLRAPETEAYLNGVMARLRPPTLAGGAQVHLKVLVDPHLNAFALPDGTIYVHSGILARLENEAQLATVLGHELTHATHRDGLKQVRDLKNKTAFMAAFNAGTLGAGGLFGALGAAASVSGYAQDLERAADTSGFELMAGAGYDPRESVKVFRVLLAEVNRSKLREPYFFGSHPRLAERLASYEHLVAALPDGRREGRIAADDYDAHLPDLLAGNAEAAQRAGDHDFAVASAERLLRIRPDEPRGSLLLAEIHRKGGSERELAEALRLYRDLNHEAPELADPYRGLGLVLLKQGAKAEAAAAFRHYLQLAPQAEDRAHIEKSLQLCENQP
jgi:predicted Zn-dependent protease